MARTIEGGVVVVSIAVPGSDDELVLLDPERRPPGVLPWHPFQNVLRVDRKGETRWRAGLVPEETTAKCWQSIELNGVRLTARTYSYVCDLDLVTGRIISKTFVK